MPACSDAGMKILSCSGPCDLYKPRPLQDVAHVLDDDVLDLAKAPDFGARGNAGAAGALDRGGTGDCGTGHGFAGRSAAGRLLVDGRSAFRTHRHTDDPP